ncbi:hypothetical protein [Oceanibacterium hippocampi]|uniref:Uncharacterized protein n=1 Tax=Oceanibacterium hippocampi TaxID=745714 RepID=A0A1Y5U584_9PROT|nr:hypothetical protein [Oceanibacterium hippocampi]SLN77261.1 hypothetical protein OCH7691_04355 [Oceanibacterium hippocampi]
MADKGSADGGLIARRATVGDEYEIVYRGSKGAMSRRGITVQRFEGKKGDIELKAICHMRHATRTFLVSGIVELTDLKTGEVTDNPALIQALFTGDLTGDALRDHGDMLTLLAALARCESPPDAPTLTVIGDCLAEWVGELELDRGRVERHIKGLEPDGAGVQALVSGLGDWPVRRLAALLRAAERVIRASGADGPDKRTFFLEAMRRSAGL